MTSLVSLFSEIFFRRSEPAVFQEVFLDKTSAYQSDLPKCFLDGAYVALRYSESFRQVIVRLKYH